MEFTSVVLYEKQLVYYNVFSKDGWIYTARLLQCSYNLTAWPPLQIELYKEGLCWKGNAEESLVKCLGFDIDQKLAGILSQNLHLNSAAMSESYK